MNRFIFPEVIRVGGVALFIRDSQVDIEELRERLIKLSQKN